MTDEDAVYVGKLSWVLFFWPILFSIFSIALGIYVPQIQQIALIIAAISVIWILMNWVTYHYSSITIKKSQVILRTGLLVRKTTDIPLDKIESIDIRQSILGSILSYGMLIITGTGGTRHFVNLIDKPLTCRRYIEQLMHAG
jgi:uncharacterized membrane protein YdbT with pleckstrin-like domain